MKILTKMPDQVFCTDSEEFYFLNIDKSMIYGELVVQKPSAGLWTSSKYYDAPYVSAWEEWCQIADFHCGKHHFLLHPKKNLKVFEPTKLSDLQTLEPDIPIDPYIDFQWYVQQGYDGFHISERGLGMHKDGYMPFHCWDCESTVWFGYDWIESVERIM